MKIHNCFGLITICITASIIAWSAPNAVAADKAVGLEAIRAVDHIGGQRYALIIGINQYVDAQIPALTTCENDAKNLYALLTAPDIGGVAPANATLLLGTQATTLNIRKSLAQLRQIPADSTVFIFFSGHGAKEAGEAYWVTQDCELGALAATALADTDIRRFLDRIPSQRTIVMLDCCYAAATIKGGKSSIADFSDTLKKFTGQGRAFLMAAGSGEEAIEAQDLQRSVFSHYLIEGLGGLADANRDGVIVLPELTAYIDKHVADEARIRGGIQRPVVSLDQVREPTKFQLTINAKRLYENLLETAQARAQRKHRLNKVWQLYMDEQITREQYQLGEQLFNAAQSQLNEYDQRRLSYYQKLADGSLAPGKLDRALAAIPLPAQQHQSLTRTSSPAPSTISSAAALPTQVGQTCTNSIGMTLAYIPAGRSMMGSTLSAEESAKTRWGGSVEFHQHEHPRHSVNFSRPILMAVTEVTQEQWQKVMGYEPSYFVGRSRPVESVSWQQAVQFCKKLSEIEGRTYRLPTEAEWEYACRAGTTTLFCFGSETDQLFRYANYFDAANPNNYSGRDTRHNDGHAKTANVQSYLPNNWGLYDMHGNVSEWCGDWYADYTAEPQTDPAGPAQGEERVYRGGDWMSSFTGCRAADRRQKPAHAFSNTIGFRVVLELQ